MLSSKAGSTRRPLTSRLVLVATGLATAATVLTACGEDDDSAGSSGEAITIQHIHGTTEITGTPERVVALSSVDADTAIALGVPPLLAPQAPGTEPGELTPWFAESAGSADVTIINVAGGDQGREIPFERVAAAEPDVILGMGFGLLVDAEESTVSLMTGLGFTLSPEVDQLEATTGYATQVSRERAGLLDADVTLVYAPQPDVQDAYLADPLVGALDVVQRGAFIRVDRLLWGAFRNPSVLSIPYSVDQIVPQLAGLDLGGA